MYYMPHSPAIRKNGFKTKARVEFDSSSKCTNDGTDDCLIPGENLNPCTLNLILCFRKFKYAFSTNIENAFLQIGISEMDRDVLRFL